MKMKIKMKGVLFLIIIFSVFFAKAQEITKERTINYINDKLKNNCVVDATTNQLTLQFYKAGKIYRQDAVTVKDLNYENVIYKAEENTIAIYCINTDEDCIMRLIYKDNIKKWFSRITINIENLDEKSINGLIKAFSHLIKSYHVPDYKLYEYFE